MLITDLAPWSSLVQRFGRCHRIGEPEWDGEIYWLDVDVDKGLPYQKDELDKAKQYLVALEGQDASPKSLEDFRFEGERVELKFERHPCRPAAGPARPVRHRAGPVRERHRRQPVRPRRRPRDGRVCVLAGFQPKGWPGR